jgi:hypothetical protein
VIELGAVGYLGARAAGSSPRRAVRECLAAAFLGVVMVVSKTFLH